MNLSLFLLLPALLHSADSLRDRASPVFRGVAADGTVLFGDRPSRVSRQGAAAPNPVLLPNANVIPSPAAPLTRPAEQGTPHHHRSAAVPDRQPADEPLDEERCQHMRIRLAKLWQERRQGYEAARGDELKRSIRRLQSHMKQRCGKWR